MNDTNLSMYTIPEVIAIFKATNTISYVVKDPETSACAVI